MFWSLLRALRVLALLLAVSATISRALPGGTPCVARRGWSISLPTISSGANRLYLTALALQGRAALFDALDVARRAALAALH